MTLKTLGETSLAVLVLAAAFVVLAAPTVAASSELVIRDPKYDVGKYDVQTASDAKHGDYLFVQKDRQGVCIGGPTLTAVDDDLFRLSGEKMEFVNPRTTSADGIRVRANDRLQYVVDGDDFEYEVALAMVRLIRADDGIRSEFVFVGTGDGVAHRLSLSAVVDGKTVATGPHFAIESR